MENIIIPNPKKFEATKKKILQEGSRNFHVIADFDKTLTHAFTNRNKVMSIIAILRNKNYLTEDYPKKAYALFDEYHPIEINPNIQLKEKKKAMDKWWKEHFRLLIKSGLNLKDIEKLVDEGEIKLRKYVLEFIDFLYTKKIPLIIMSAGLGDAIKLFLEKEKRLYENVHIVSNFFEWENDGKAKSVKQPVIHSINKDEHSLEKLPIYTELQNRKNVLLLGDGLGDLGMITGFKFNNLISIGFLNDKVEENLSHFKKNFDVILTGDGDAKFIYDFVKEF